MNAAGGPVVDAIEHAANTSKLDAPERAVSTPRADDMSMPPAESRRGRSARASRTDHEHASDSLGQTPPYI